MAIFRLPDLRGILRDLKDEILRDRVLAVAAGVTFYALLAIVPAITALISVFGLILAPSEVPDLLAPLYGFAMLCFFVYCYPIERFTLYLERRFHLHQ